MFVHWKYDIHLLVNKYILAKLGAGGNYFNGCGYIHKPLVLHGDNLIGYDMIAVTV